MTSAAPPTAAVTGGDAFPFGRFATARASFRLESDPGRPTVDGLRVRLYRNAGLRLVCTIAGATHHVSAHRASPTAPAVVPAAAVCRTCRATDCVGCRLALVEVYRWRPDWDGAEGRYAREGYVPNPHAPPPPTHPRTQ